jgi:hypothetical protein
MTKKSEEYNLLKIISYKEINNYFSQKK